MAISNRINRGAAFGCANHKELRNAIESEQWFDVLFHKLEGFGFMLCNIKGKRIIVYQVAMFAWG